MPWIAIELGWLVAEYGRQPWVVEGVLPTFYAASGLTITDLAISLGFFLTLYTTLAIIAVWLMVRVVKVGPVDNPLFDGLGGATLIPEGVPALPHR